MVRHTEATIHCNHSCICFSPFPTRDHSTTVHVSWCHFYSKTRQDFGALTQPQKRLHLKLDGQPVGVLFSGRQQMAEVVTKKEDNAKSVVHFMAARLALEWLFVLSCRWCSSITASEQDIYILLSYPSLRCDFREQQKCWDTWPPYMDESSLTAVTTPLYILVYEGRHCSVRMSRCQSYSAGYLSLSKTERLCLSLSHMILTRRCSGSHTQHT